MFSKSPFLLDLWISPLAQLGQNDCLDILIILLLPCWPGQTFYIQGSYLQDLNVNQPRLPHVTGIPSHRAPPFRCFRKPQTRIPRSRSARQVSEHPAIPHYARRISSRPRGCRYLGELLPRCSQHHHPSPRYAILRAARNHYALALMGHSRRFRQRIKHQDRQFRHCQVLRQQQPKRSFQHVRISTLSE